jgi:hypothetical protein
MKIEKTWTGNWENAVWGMRAAMNSWDKIDSLFTSEGGLINFGEADNALAKNLIRSGTEHCKFLRAIHVSCFITISRGIWQELDTYKVATTRLSCSTMHKLGFRDLEKSDFQDDVVLEDTLANINFLGRRYRDKENILYKSVTTLHTMKLQLPEGFLQGAVYDCSYQTLMTMYHQRKNHRMPEWSGKGGICEWIESLPMMREWLHLKDEKL